MQKSNTLTSLEKRMKKEGSGRDENSIPLPRGVVFTDSGAEFPDDMTEDEWVEVGIATWKAGQRIQWFLIDWIKWAQDKWGETYLKALERTPYAYGTLRNLISVDNNLSRRRDKLGFGHHAAVASLPHRDQDRILDRAEKGTWTVLKVREEAKKVREKESGAQIAEHIEIKRVNRALGYIGNVRMEALANMNAGELAVMQEKIAVILQATTALSEELESAIASEAKGVER